MPLAQIEQKMETASGLLLVGEAEVNFLTIFVGNEEARPVLITKGDGPFVGWLRPSGPPLCACRLGRVHPGESLRVGCCL